MSSWNAWTTATRPATPSLGLSGYNTDLGENETWNGVAWVPGGVYPPTPNTLPVRGVQAEILAGFVSPGGVLQGTTDITSAGLYGPVGLLDGQQLSLDVNGGGLLTLTFSGLTSSASETAMFAAIEAMWPGLLATQAGVNLALRNLTPDGTIVVGAGTADGSLGLTPGSYRILPSGGFVRLPSAVVVGAPVVALEIQSSVAPASALPLVVVDAIDTLYIGDQSSRMPLWVAGGANASALADPGTNPTMLFFAYPGVGIASAQFDTTRFYVGSPFQGDTSQFAVYPGALTANGATALNFDDPVAGGGFIEVAVTAAATLSAPTNIVQGGFYTFVVTQTGGPWGLTWDPVFEFGSNFNGTLTRLANAVDVFQFIGDSDGGGGFLLRCVSANKNLDGPAKITSQVAVTKATAQSIPDDLNWHKVTTWDAGGINTDSAGGAPFDTGTGTFTAPATGYYFVDSHMQFASAKANLLAPFGISIFVNGARQATDTFRNPVAGDPGQTNHDVRISRMFRLNAGDTVDVELSQTSGFGAVNTQTDATTNMLSIFSVDGPVPSPTP